MVLVYDRPDSNSEFRRPKCRQTAQRRVDFHVRGPSRGFPCIWQPVSGHHTEVLGRKRNLGGNQPGAAKYISATARALDRYVDSGAKKKEAGPSSSRS